VAERADEHRRANRAQEPAAYGRSAREIRKLDMTLQSLRSER
jgi:hypothetical protein